MTDTVSLNIPIDICWLGHCIVCIPPEAEPPVLSLKLDALTRGTLRQGDAIRQRAVDSR